MNEGSIIDYEERIPRGYVIVGRLRVGMFEQVLAALPDQTSGLLLLGRELRIPPGWCVVGADEMVGPRGSLVLATDATWRAWRLYFAARRMALRALHPSACRVLVVLARLARVEIPLGVTWRGALEKMGSAVEADRRRRA